MANKGWLTDDKIVIESENVKIKSKGKNSMLVIKARDVINNKKIFVEMFNNHYVNIVENSTGVAPAELGTLLDPNFEMLLKKSWNIRVKWKLKNWLRPIKALHFPQAKTEDVNKIIASLNSKKLLVIN